MPNEPQIEADYLIIGAGAVAMAFADTVLNESNSTAIMIDRRHRPGGHWNDAYPFVRLHGPSVNYGVNSRHLGSDRIDQSGLNEGLFELATGSEICTYFDEVMRHTLLPTGRLTYLPMHEYDHAGHAVSLLSGKRVAVKARKKIVDATFADTHVPSRTPPAFAVGDDVTLVTPNEAPNVATAGKRIIVLGAGKTAIDTVTWLISHDADPDRITWVRPRDAWLWNRATLQPAYDFINETFGAMASGLECAANATGADDLFLALERDNQMQRIDPAVTPTMFRCAIVSDRELEMIRRVKNVVRLGHVKAIEGGKILLEHGVLETGADAVIINCTACGIPRKPHQPIFQDGKIVLQYVRTCNPTFSGALVAKVELALEADGEKNALCAPTPIPSTPFDYFAMILATQKNASAWQRQDWLMQWLVASRLDRFSAMTMRAQAEDDAAALQTLGRYRAALKPGLEKMAQLMAAGV